MTRFDSSTYPGWRPEGPTLVYQGEVWPARLGETVTDAISVDSAASGARVLDPSEVSWYVADGSNACPDRLIDKALDGNGCLLLPASVPDVVPAWEARRALSGSVPLTLVPQRGHRLDTWLVGVHSGDAGLLEASEQTGVKHELGAAADVAVASRWHLSWCAAFGPTARTRVLTIDATTLATYPAQSQADAEARLDSGVSMAAEPLPGIPHRRPTITDLDLFVYGSLQPGGERWTQVAELVDAVGEVWTGGTVTNTFYGWPAARFSDDAAGVGNRVVGTLVRAVDSAAAGRLFAACDQIEDVPRLFRRTTVRVHWAGGSGWGAAYEWNPAQGAPPGDLIPDGRWHP